MGVVILLTGAGGFLGSHLLDQILGRTDHKVICTDSFRHNGSTDALTDVFRKHMATGHAHRGRLLTHDLTAPFSPRQVFALGEVRYIINAAAGCSVDESVAEPASFIRNNVDSVLTVLELARALDVERFVQVSTDEVYGDHSHRTPTDHRPSSPYAASKACQEDICHAYARTYGIPMTVVNSCNMFGERQSMLAFIPQICRKLITGETIQIHTVGGQPGVRTYSYAGNVARHIVDGVGNMPRREHLRGQVTLDNATLVDLVAFHAGLEPKTELVEASTVRPGYDKCYHPLDVNNEWAPEVPYNTAISRTVEWFMTNRDWLGL